MATMRPRSCLFAFGQQWLVWAGSGHNHASLSMKPKWKVVLTGCHGCRLHISTWKDVCFQRIDSAPLASLALRKDFCFPFIPALFAWNILTLFRDEPGDILFWSWTSAGFERRRHSHISVPDGKRPQAMTGGEMEFGLWWAFLFLRNALVEGHALTGINRWSGALISVIHFHRRQFSVPRWNVHRAERLMEKEMKLITRS